MQTKQLGVIGGMGPKATSVFMERVIANTVADQDQEHIDMVILNHVSLPDRTSIILNQKDETLLNMLAADIRLLDIAGVDHIAVPCNTVHYFYDHMQRMTKIPIINMVEETVKQVVHAYGRKAKVSILATNGTIRSEIYQRAFDQYGMRLHTPHDLMQEKVMKMIYDHVKGNMATDASELEKMIKTLVVQEQCQCVLIACTELSCIQLSEHIAAFCIDAMDVLVSKAIELSGKKIKGQLRELGGYTHGLQN